MQMQNFEKHVWAEIDLDALRANFRTVKQRAGSLPLCAVVKADSYGHGAVQCARIFAQEGASWLAVSCLAEALQRFEQCEGDFDPRHLHAHAEKFSTENFLTGFRHEVEAAMARM